MIDEMTCRSNAYPQQTERHTPAYKGVGTYPSVRYRDPAPSLQQLVTALGPGAAREGRTWHGWHHHATLVPAAHAGHVRGLEPGAHGDRANHRCAPAKIPGNHSGTPAGTTV
jgi:hypothetical protein